MEHYSCLTCLREAGFPEWYLTFAVRGEPRICCCCARMITEWIPCRSAPGTSDQEICCAAVHLEDVM